jgi:hypothetical protein
MCKWQGEQAGEEEGACSAQGLVKCVRSSADSGDSNSHANRYLLGRRAERLTTGKGRKQLLDSRGACCIHIPNNAYVRKRALLLTY